MKKGLSVFLVLVLAMFTCGSIAAQASEQVTLEFWSFHSTIEAEALQRYCAKYTAEVNPNVKINYTQIPWDDYIGTKLTTAFAAGEGPDIFFTCPPQLARYVEAGVTLPLDDYLTPEEREDFRPAALAATTLDGKLCAYPIEAELLALFYDIDAFKEAGLNPPTTWDEMLADAKALTTDKRAGLTMRIADDSTVVFHYLPFLTMGGGDVFTDDFKGSGLGSQANIDALQLYHDLMTAGAINVKPSRSADDIGILAEGETAMQINGTWSLVKLEQQYSDKHIGVVPLPVKDASMKSASAAGGWQMAVNARSPRADEAAKFITWLCAEDKECLTDWCTVVKFAYPTRNSIVEANQDFFQKGLRAVFTNQILGTEKPELRAPADVYKILQDMIQDAMYSSDGKTAAEKGDQKLKDFFADYDGII